jgi:hypothetical protein
LATYVRNTKQGLAPWIQDALSYVAQRRNADGGYNFCQGLASGSQDTYYALALFSLLGLPTPDRDSTANWLRGFPARDIFSYYYVTKGLTLCGDRVDDSLVTRVLGLLRSSGGFGDVRDVGVEAFSEFETTYMATEILRELRVAFPVEATTQWLLSYQNSDGGFGIGQRSNLISTFHAVASLSNLRYPVQESRTTVNYTRSCEKTLGGFTAVPEVSLPYLEDIYAGIMLLDMFGERPAYRSATRGMVLGMQNNNGGFRRSLELGLSGFEDTYRATRILLALDG